MGYARAWWLLADVIITAPYVVPVAVVLLIAAIFYVSGESRSPRIERYVYTAINFSVLVLVLYALAAFVFFSGVLRPL